MYAVVVLLRIKEGSMEAFLPAMTVNAQTSLAEEPGCLRFDVCTDPDHPREVFLYELYTDRAAFDAHLESAHFNSFDSFVAPMLETKEVRTYRQVAT